MIDIDTFLTVTRAVLQLPERTSPRRTAKADTHRFANALNSEAYPGGASPGKPELKRRLQEANKQLHEAEQRVRVLLRSKESAANREKELLIEREVRFYAACNISLS
jgi:hypothetical protein